MRIYKFRDLVDGRYAFVLADSLMSAMKKLNEVTSVKFMLIDEKSPEDLKAPIILRNDILPF